MIPLLFTVLAAQPNPYLVQVKLFQQSGDYKSCLKRIEQAQKWESSREEQLDIAIFAGLCNFALLKTKEAENEFTIALQIDPAAKLPAFSSPKVVALFESLRPKQATVAPVPAPTPPQPSTSTSTSTPAPTPSPAPAVVEAPRPAAASTSHVPLVPIIAGGVGLASLAVGVALGVNAGSLQNQANAATFQIDAYQMKQSANGSAIASDIAYAVAGAALIAAVILFFVTRGD